MFKGGFRLLGNIRYPRRTQWNPVVLQADDPNSRAIVSIVTLEDNESISIKTLPVLVHMDATASYKPIQVEFEISVPGSEPVSRTQQSHSVQVTVALCI